MKNSDAAQKALDHILKHQDYLLQMVKLAHELEPNPPSYIMNLENLAMGELDTACHLLRHLSNALTRSVRDVQKTHDT